MANDAIPTRSSLPRQRFAYLPIPRAARQVGERTGLPLVHLVLSPAVEAAGRLVGRMHLIAPAVSVAARHPGDDDPV